MTFTMTLSDARLLKDALIRTLVETGIWHTMDDPEDKQNILAYMMHVANTTDSAPLPVAEVEIKQEPTDEERNARKGLPSKAKAKAAKPPTPRKAKTPTPKKEKKEKKVERASSVATVIELSDAEKAALTAIGPAKRKIIVAE